MKYFLLSLFIIVSLFSFAQTDSASYHSITKLNDSTLVFNRLNGTKDTIVFSFFPSGVTTSYANSGGTGDRSGVITISVSNNAAWRYGNEGEMINGNTTGATFWSNGNSVSSSTWMKFDFGSGHTKIIQEAKWYQSTSDTHGTFKWQGSNDNSTWTDIGSSFTLGGSSPQTQTSLSGNTTAYRYYQLIGVSGTMSGTPYIYEIEFKIN